MKDGTNNKEELTNKGVNDITMLVILNQGNCKIGTIIDSGRVIEKVDAIIKYS